MPLCFQSQADERTVNAFVHALTDNDSDSRMEAAISLGDLGDPSAVEPLILALKDGDEYVRYEAAGALGKIECRYLYGRETAGKD
jgi:HEAT repeat protein